METVVLPANEKIEHYRALVLQLLRTDAQAIQPSHGEIETLMLVDQHQDSYMLLYLGWSGSVRHHDVIVHIRIRDEKIWIERDGTTEGFANALVAAGVPAEDIELAFHHPRKRPFTGFGDGVSTHTAT